MLKFIKRLVIFAIYVVTFITLFIALVLVMEFSPKNGEELKVIGKDTKTLKVGDTLTLLTYNIGHLVSNSEATCYLEGGTMVRAESEEIVNTNLENVQKIIADAKADIVTLQEVDYKSDISYKVNEYIEIANAYEGISSIALFQDAYVPYPVDNMVGKVKTGIATLSKYNFVSCRVNIEDYYEFPERIIMPKKCIQKNIVDIDGTDKKLVVLNVELEDYDDGIIRTKQLSDIKDEMLMEYDKGNYVIVSGDFNMVFPEVDNANNFKNEYVVISVGKDYLPEGWKYGVDKAVKTFRLRDVAYNKETSFTSIVDGFIVSPNITIKSVKTVDTEFKYSNHNPVKIEITLNK